MCSFYSGEVLNCTPTLSCATSGSFQRFLIIHSLTVCLKPSPNFEHALCKATMTILAGPRIVYNVLKSCILARRWEKTIVGSALLNANGHGFIWLECRNVRYGQRPTNLILSGNPGLGIFLPILSYEPICGTQCNDLFTKSCSQLQWTGYGNTLSAWMG